MEGLAQGGAWGPQGFRFPLPVDQRPDPRLPLAQEVLLGSAESVVGIPQLSQQQGVSSVHGLETNWENFISWKKRLVT